MQLRPAAVGHARQDQPILRVVSVVVPQPTRIRGIGLISDRVVSVGGHVGSGNLIVRHSSQPAGKIIGVTQADIRRRAIGDRAIDCHVAAPVAIDALHMTVRRPGVGQDTFRHVLIRQSVQVVVIVIHRPRHGRANRGLLLRHLPTGRVAVSEGRVGIARIDGRPHFGRQPPHDIFKGHNGLPAEIRHRRLLDVA